MKRYFLLDLGYYGAEFTMGHSTKAFVDYWTENENLSDHLWNPDSNSPPMNEDGAEDVIDVCDIAWFTMPYADDRNKVTMREVFIDEDGADFDDADDLISRIENEQEEYLTAEYWELKQVFTLEKYISSTVYKEGTTPVLCVAATSKGLHAEAIVVTEGDAFDMSLLGCGITETPLGQFVTHLFYDRKPLQISYYNLSTSGSHYEAEVGWEFDEYIESEEKYFDDGVPTELLRECITEAYENNA